MFELVDLYESDAKNDEALKNTDEAEIYGGAIEGHIKLDKLLDWMRKVKADENAQYLKCLNWRSSHVDINSIVDVTYSENVEHKEETFEHAVQIAFKEGGDSPAMTVARAAELFEAVAAKCEENGVDLGTVEVFVQNEKGKLTYFSWFYDEGTDTAVIVKNMTVRAAAKFLKDGAEAVVVKAAKTATTPKSVEDEIAELEKTIADLQAKKQAAYDKLGQKADDEWADAKASDSPFAKL